MKHLGVLLLPLEATVPVFCQVSFLDSNFWYPFILLDTERGNVRVKGLGQEHKILTLMIRSGLFQVWIIMFHHIKLQRYLIKYFKNIIYLECSHIFMTSLLI